MIPRPTSLSVFVWGLTCVLTTIAVASCGGRQTEPPPTPERLEPADRILAVATAWNEKQQTEAFMNQPDVAFIRVQDSFTLHLRGKEKVALVDIKRDELIRTPQGREYHCEVVGSIRSPVGYEWRLDEAAVTVKMPQATLPRRCKEPGFSRPSKVLSGVNITYVLRGDRLVAVDPPTLRSALLPVDE